MSFATPIFEHLVIRKDSWHYRYFLFIRRFYGLDQPPARTSLCPYCQTMFWFTFFAVLLSPIFAGGWIILKFFRITYKLFDKLGFNSVIDWLDTCGIGKFFDEAADHIEDNPAMTTAATFFFTSMFLAFCFGLIAVVLFTLVEFIIHVPSIPHYLYVAITVLWHFLKTAFWFIGYGLFYVAFAIGFAEQFVALVARTVWSGLVWFFTNGSLWSTILHVIEYLVVLGGGSWLICLGVWKFSQSPTGKRVMDFFVFKLNGYGEARKKAKARREAFIAAQPPVPVEEKPYVRPAWLVRIDKWKKDVFEWLWSVEIPVGDVATTVASPAKILWMWLCAMKKGVCPIVEFIDEETLKRVVEISKACEGHDLLDVNERERYRNADSDLNARYENGKPWVWTKEALFQTFLVDKEPPKPTTTSSGNTSSATYYWTNTPKPFPNRVKIAVGKYILGQSTFEMLKETVAKDLKAVFELKDQQDKAEEAMRKFRAANPPAPLTEEQKMKAITDLTQKLKDMPDDGSGNVKKEQ